jgi:cell division septum initiation protein DivIVA
LEITVLLDRLEDRIAQATKVPFTGKILVDPDELLAVIDEMREELPQELREANRVASNRETIIAEAREQAESMVREAQTYSVNLTSEASINKEAQFQADELIDQAKRVAREIRQNALEWADDLFAHVQPDMESVALETQRAAVGLRKAREELRQQL